MTRFLALERRRAAIEARGARRRALAAAKAERRRAEREDRYERRRRWRKNGSRRIRRGLLHVNAVVRSLPEDVRAAYDTTTPEVRRLIVQQHEDDARRIVGTGIDFAPWHPDTRSEWSCSWNAARHRANADSPRRAS